MIIEMTLGDLLVGQGKPHIGTNYSERTSNK